MMSTPARSMPELQADSTGDTAAGFTAAALVDSTEVWAATAVNSDFTGKSPPNEKRVGWGTLKLFPYASPWFS